MDQYDFRREPYHDESQSKTVTYTKPAIAKDIKTPKTAKGKDAPIDALSKESSDTEEDMNMLCWQTEEFYLNSGCYQNLEGRGRP